MPLEVSGPSNPQKTAPSLRLDSWKQIAAYLCRGERTVKRWETERGLPIHRLPGGGRGSVHAFTAELDEWLVSAEALEIEIGEEADAAEKTEAEAALPAEAQPTAPTGISARKARGRFRRIPVSLLLAAAVYFVVSLFFVLRGGGRIFLFRDSKPARAPISEPERQLAHQLYLQGRFEWNKRTPESLNRVLDDFTQALIHDPEDAQTYVGLADTYNLLREFSAMPENEAYSRALTASRKAVELDDSLAEAHRSLAFAEIYGEWNFKDGVREFRRAIELNPTDPLTHLWLANALAKEGRLQQAFSEINRAQELDPTSPSILADKGYMLFYIGKVREEGIGLLKQVERTDPEFISPHRYLAGIYMSLKDYLGFLAESAITAQMTGDPVLKAITASAQEGFLRDGERGLLQGLYTAQKKYHEEGKLPGISLARTCVLIGRRQEAVQLLGEDYQQHTPELIDILGDSALAPLKDEPEVRKILSSIQVSALEDAAGAEAVARK